MAELEVHTEVENKDPTGKKIGVMASVIAVFLAIVTIVSHRAHTDAVLYKSDANDKWAYFQSKRIKFHSLELGEDLMKVQRDPAPAVADVLARYAKEKERYAHDSDAAQEDALKMDRKAEHTEAQALRFDFGEGLLEIGMVLTSLYFISRSMLFPVVGGIAAAAGLITAITGWMV